MRDENSIIRIIPTNDGSNTLIRKDLDETYHSIHGAINESQHVFIDHGLSLFENSETAINVFEMGFGSGLNAMMALKWVNDHNRDLNYTSIENFPIPLSVIKQTNYVNIESCKGLKDDFFKMHEVNWDIEQIITKRFNLLKLKGDLLNHKPLNPFDIIFFDAFSPTKQPELWELSVFQKMYSLLNPNGALVTYCAKGYVRRNMIAAGFEVEKLPGPPGKREMLRARKVI